jgi:single-stranded DNA-specific DHH superfamily exonuclease
MDKIVIIYEKNKTGAKVSARNQSRKYDVGKLLQKAMHGIKGSAGGHEAAAGATMPAKDWEKFKEQLVALTG